MATPIPADRNPQLFQPADEVETPALVVDLDVMERNLDRMAALADDHDVDLRPHAKTQKIAEIAHRQVAAGATGILCQTLGEAEVMAAHGHRDVHLVRMAVTPGKLDRLVQLADRLPRFATTVDAAANLDPLVAAVERAGTTVGVVVEVDCGLGRTGSTPEGAVSLARTIVDHPQLTFEGILGHDGFVKHRASTEAEFVTLCDEVVETLERTVERLDGEGIAVPAVKTGSSATAPHMAGEPVVTELNPGRYAFWDALHLELLDDVRRADCAVYVPATVISTASPGRAVFDVGSKALSAMGSPRPVSRHREDLAVRGLSSEHLVVEVDGTGASLAVGDRVEFIVPSVIHAINLHDVLVGVRDGRVEEIWDVQARGKYR